MRVLTSVVPVVLVSVLSASSAWGQYNTRHSQNAALRYWSAFSVVQDAGITEQQAKELNAILDGIAPYEDSKYRDLLEKNSLALQIMARGSSIPNCDWGMDYGLGDDTPVDYVRKALALGRLNVFYALHLFRAGKKDQAVRALTTGLKFSSDVANGGSLFATVVAKDLLMRHLQAISDALQLEHLSAIQRVRIEQAVKKLGHHGVDWRSAIKVEMELLNQPSGQKSVPLTQVTEAYLAVADDPSQLGSLQQQLATVPQPLRDVIPNPREVVQQKRELDDKITQITSLLP